MDYTIIRKNIKNTYIQIKDGQVIVKAPRKMPDKDIEKLISEKENWINKHLKTQAQKEQDNKNCIELLGKKYNINVIDSNRDCIEIDGNYANVYTNEDSKEKTDKLIKKFYKKCALKQYSQTTQKMMNLTGLKPDSWQIKDIHSAWGSCSSKRNITLSLKLVQKKEVLIEYVVLHELCHLKHMNHSHDFWDLVGRYMPNYKECRKELRK